MDFSPIAMTLSIYLDTQPGSYGVFAFAAENSEGESEKIKYT